MLSDPVAREILLEVLLLLLCIDTVFAGFILGSLLRLLGVATWFRGVAADETVLYHYRGGGVYYGWSLWGLINAIVSNKRFIARILWSRVALVDVPLATLRYVRPATWWGTRTIEVGWGTSPRVRSITLITTPRIQSNMLRVFESAGVHVETS